jgi:predicted naringenin-chalcone synthase
LEGREWLKRSTGLPPTTHPSAADKKSFAKGPCDEQHYDERIQRELKDQIDARALQRQLGVAYGENSQEMYDAELKLKVFREQVSPLRIQWTRRIFCSSKCRDGSTWPSAKTRF